MGTLLDVESLRLAAAQRSFEYRFFWGAKARKDGALSDACFSQWWPCRFTAEGQVYCSAEQFMMASKARLFGDEETRAEVLATSDPGRAKALGRRVRGFVSSTWEAARFDLVTNGNLAKFGENDSLRYYLLSTKDDILVEASPVDPIWGIGLAAGDPDAIHPARWRGLNLLGFALARTRAILRGELPRP